MMHHPDMKSQVPFASTVGNFEYVESLFFCLSGTIDKRSRLSGASDTWFEDVESHDTRCTLRSTHPHWGDTGGGAAGLNIRERGYLQDSGKH